MRFVFILICVFCIAGISPVYAASSESKSDFVFFERELDAWRGALKVNSQRYDELLKDLKKNSDQILHKTSMLRWYYSNSEQYVPFSKPVLDQLTRYAALIEESEDREIIKKVLINYRTLLDKHLANIEVLDFALMMSRIDVRFGDESFFKTVRNGIITALESGRNGLSPENAYRIITYGEESYILARFGGEIKKSEIYPVHQTYYNVHDIVTTDGEDVQIFVDITDPVKTVKFRQIVQERERGLSVSRP